MSDDTQWLTDITQIVTSVGVILTAISSIMNRFKLESVDKKVNQAKAAIQETQNVAIAVNAEVVKEVHDVGVAAGKAINGGNNNGNNKPKSG